MPTPPTLLVVTDTAGYVHDVDKPRDGKPTVVEEVFTNMGRASGAFQSERVRDAKMITKDRLKDVKAIVFFTCQAIPLDVDAVVEWTRGGGACIPMHGAADTLHGNEAWFNLIGSEFSEHPWTLNHTVTIKTHENNPITAPFAPEATFQEELYDFKRVDWANIKVLMSLDMVKTKEPKRPHHVPVAWCRTFGKGKVFYTSLGHRQDIWENPKFQSHLLAGIRWAMNLDPMDATPNPKVHEVEQQIAIDACGT